MERTRTLRIWGGFWLLLLLLFVFLLWNIFAGSVSLSASEIWRILLGGDVGFTHVRHRISGRLHQDYLRQVYRQGRERDPAGKEIILFLNKMISSFYLSRFTADRLGGGKKCIDFVF